VESPLRQHLVKVLSDYNPDRWWRRDKNMSSLKNYLILSNDHMKSMVASFIYKNVNLKKSEYANIEKFINNIDKWSIDTPQHLRGLDYEDGFTFVQSIKNSVNDICKTIPTIILNKSGINGGNTGTFPGFIAEMCTILYLRTTPSFRFTRKRISNVLDKIYNKTRYPVAKNIPLFSPFWNGGESTFYKMTSPLYAG
jgi:hypothetical protein